MSDAALTDSNTATASPLLDAGARIGQFDKDDIAQAVQPHGAKCQPRRCQHLAWPIRDLQKISSMICLLVAEMGV